MVNTISHNRIKDLDPNQFEKLVNLHELYLANNQINKLSPNQFDALDKFQRLYLSNNQIKELDPNQFSALFDLQLLYLENNKIKKFSFNELKQLKVLDISCNQLEEFVSSISKSNITELNLFNNKLIHFSFQNKSLKKLDLSCN